ncbi:hypothetical protein TWF730_008502 [Orbilia blumenaviensis]|uniref:Uncharacterized protein n=1 Tax=Orbilia blumenaviensis TaxID=1796055 RepID=A0AAV9V5N0_9PEZI
MNLQTSFPRTIGRIQRFREFGGWQQHVVYSRRVRLQLPSTFLNPTVNTLQFRDYSSRLNVPFIESCPCESDITIPDLGTEKIDQTSTLAGVITRHYRHVLVHTGTIDWPSRIEDSTSNSKISKLKSMIFGKTDSEQNTSITTKLKSLVSRGSIYVDPFHPILVTNTSLPTDPSAKENHGTISIFPDAIELTSIENSTESIRSLLTSFLLSPSNPLSSTHQERGAFTTKKITKPVILTCSHGNRDKRCGILGPAITKAFKESLERDRESNRIDCIVGDISHIGGHKFAGNVIIHLPGDHLLSKAINDVPGSNTSVSSLGEHESNKLPMRSVSIWYGRVMPYHVEGILETTLKQGKIIKELLRGIVNSNGDLVNLQNIGLK